jgi:hypothetical protein
MMSELAAYERPECAASLTFHVLPLILTYMGSTSDSQASDEITFRCHRRYEHKTHLADRELPNLCKRVSIAWGEGGGKPRVTVTSISQRTAGKNGE